jgi:hypothetical protein
MFQFKLWHLFFYTTAAGVLLGMWSICVKPAIESGAFIRQKTYREVQIERSRQAMERANANP